MRSMSFLRFALLTGILAALPGCGGPTFVVQDYPGPVRPAQTIARLRFEGSGPVQLLAVDGQRADARVAEDARLEVELLPGKHQVMAQNLETPAEPPQSVVFQAEPGKRYRPLFMRTIESGPRLHVYEIDPRTGVPVSDATVPEHAGSAAAAPPAPPPAAMPPAEPNPPPVEPAAPPPPDADSGSPW